MVQSETLASQPIVCALDALSASERARRAELAGSIQQRALGVEESTAGFAIRLPNDGPLLRGALELILLERRCCPFLSLELDFEPGEGDARLRVGGPPGVKDFLRSHGILGCGRPAGPGACC